MIETLLMIIAILLLLLVLLVANFVLREEDKENVQFFRKQEALKVQLSKEDKAQAEALEKYDGGLRK